MLKKFFDRVTNIIALLVNAFAAVTALFVILLLLVIAIIFYGDRESSKYVMPQADQAFYDKIKEFQESDKEIVKISDLVDFHWDKVRFLSEEILQNWGRT
jgi:hypothetical protein